ncbi:hypothetical protein ABTI15_20345, partial [Acinetobacter baumannii]
MLTGWCDKADAAEPSPCDHRQRLNASEPPPNQGNVKSLPEDIMLERTPAQSPFYTQDHEAFRDVM